MLFDLTAPNQAFRERFIDGSLDHVLRACRDTNAHAEAKELIPLAELLQDNPSILDDEANYQDNLLPLVTNWFATEFMKWFEVPECERCSTTLRFRNHYVNSEDKQVEVYACDKDGFQFQFVRHNDPSILLRTRTGRCGEWAMCYFVFLRALDYHARIVYDSTDHCWNEVWSEPRKQFIHVDPCENIVDNPLLYEVGWNKKLQYCFAFGQHEVMEVTPRYSKNMRATEREQAKIIVDVIWLYRLTHQLTGQLLETEPSAEVRESVDERWRLDADYISRLRAAEEPRQIPNRSEMAGRRTGSVQWRISRGEYKPCAKSGTIIKVKPKTADDDKGGSRTIFSLEYNCDRNVYTSSVNDYNNLKNWSSIVHEYENLDHKYERDWKTSYVARYETCAHDKKGLIRWRFDVSELSQVEWDSVEILLTGKLYPNTTLVTKLVVYKSEDCVDVEAQLELTLNHATSFKRDRFSPSTKYIDILAILSGGSGDDEVAWQKPQLFRQTRGTNSDQSALYVKIH